MFIACSPQNWCYIYSSKVYAHSPIFCFSPLVTSPWRFRCRSNDFVPKNKKSENSAQQQRDVEETIVRHENHHNKKRIEHLCAMQQGSEKLKMQRKRLIGSSRERRSSRLCAGARRHWHRSIICNSRRLLNVRRAARGRRNFHRSEWNRSNCRRLFFFSVRLQIRVKFRTHKTDRLVKERQDKYDNAR